MRSRSKACVLFAALAYLLGQTATQFALPALPYSYSALEPVIDAQTNKYHHDVHHAAYINNTNAAVNAAGLLRKMPNMTLTMVLIGLGGNKLGLKGANETLLRNNAGGAWNHNLWWRVLTPPGSSNNTLPNATSPLGAAIKRDFGSADKLITELSAAAKGQFGSGWAWLTASPGSGKLAVTATPNQDNPLSIGSQHIPILGIDVWEHSYYLKYGPGKASYVDNWFKVVNWRQVEANYAAATAKTPNMAVIVGPEDRPAA